MCRIGGIQGQVNLEKNGVMQEEREASSARRKTGTRGFRASHREPEVGKIEAGHDAKTGQNLLRKWPSKDDDELDRRGGVRWRRVRRRQEEPGVGLGYGGMGLGDSAACGPGEED